MVKTKKILAGQEQKTFNRISQKIEGNKVVFSGIYAKVRQEILPCQQYSYYFFLLLII